MTRKIELDEETIKELYHKQDLSKKEVAERLDVSEMTIVRRMEEYDISTKKRSTAVAQKHPSFFQTSNEYMVAADYVGGKQQWVRIHRLLAVAEYGFDTVTNKEIHHKNHFKFDNRPSNIEPVNSKEHRQIHFSGKTNEER